MLRNLLAFIFLIAVYATSLAAQLEIQPGMYVLDGDSGTLTIAKSDNKKITFEINTVGGNGHVCGVSGVISGNVGVADSLFDEGSPSKCKISFSSIHSDIVVRPITQEACRDYCGMRAIFDGTYRIPPPACTNSGRKMSRDQFLRLYRSRQFNQAEETLNSLISQCKTYIDWIEIDQIRNDLALAQYHNGNPQKCLITLSFTLAAKAKNEEELQSGNDDVYLPPGDFYNYIDIAKSTWFNKELCSKAMSKKR